MKTTRDWSAVPDEVVAKFERDVIRVDGCWGWQGSVGRNGYARIYDQRGATPRIYLAHRVSLFLAAGPLDRELVVDHLCGNTGCTNPAHLELVTNRENLMRAHVGRRNGERMLAMTHCRAGHEFSADNVWINSRGARVCKACAKASRKKSLEKRRG